MHRRRWWKVVVGIGGALALLGVAAPTAGASAPQASGAPEGCGRAARPGVTIRTISVGGQRRQYLLEIPPGYRPHRATPLLFDFHGLGSDMNQQAAYSGLNTKGAKAGFVVLTPNGSGRRIKTWRFPPLPGSDVPTVRALLARTESALCIDPHRVYATGISAGGIFATSLPCAMPGTFAAIAPVAGVNATKVCTSGTPKVSVLAFHGTADPIVPYAGGPYFSGLTQTTPAVGGSASSAAARLRARLRGNATAALGRALQAHPVPDAIAGWAAFDGCSTRPRVHKVATDVQRTTEQHCRRHTGVQLYTVEGGGHTWPGARSLPGRPLGSVTQSIDASDLMLAFFRAHPAPH